MSKNLVILNGRNYQPGVQLGCSPVGRRPTDEQIAKMVEAGGISSNLQTDIFYYLPEEKQLCHAGIQATPRLFETLPKGPGDIKEINGRSNIEVVFMDREEGSRKLSKISVECENAAIKADLDKVQKLLGIEKGSQISSEQYEKLVKAVLTLSLQHDWLIKAELKNDPSGDGKVTLGIVANPVPQSISIKMPDEEAIDFTEHVMLREAIEGLVLTNPKAVVAMIMRLTNLPQVFADNEIMKDADFTPILKDISIDGDKLIMTVDVDRRVPEVDVVWDPEYMKFLSTRPEDEKTEAIQFLGRVRAHVQAKNLSSILAKMKEVKEFEAEGWKRMERSYMLDFEQVNIPGRVGLVFKVNRVPYPTKMVLEGDYPGEHRPEIMKFFSAAAQRGKVDLRLIDEGIAKTREFYTEKGYKVKELGYQITNDGKLHVIVNLRRWDSMYVVEVLGENGDDEKKEENRKMVREIMVLYEGKYITDEDMNAVKRKLARGLSRNEIQEVIATDEKSGKTKVIFMASEGKPQRMLSGAGGISSIGLMLNGKFAILDNGRGTSYSVSYTNHSKWSFYENWDTKDIFYHSLNLGFSTTVSPNAKLSVAVYGYARSYKDDSQKGVGTNVTYHTYHLNDRLTLSMGGAFEVVDQPDGVEGYTDIPVRLRPHAGICYRDGNFSVCVNNSLSTLSSNYGKNEVYVQYSLPLGSEKENAPYIVFKGSGGVMFGEVPELEQFYQMSTKMPFSFSLTNGDIHFGKYYGGAAAELAWRLNSWFAIKPIVLAAMMVGDYAKAVSGSCLDLGPFEFCGGYRKGLTNNASDGLDISLGPVDGVEVPEELRYFFDQLFLRDQMGEF